MAKGKVTAWSYKNFLSLFLYFRLCVCLSFFLCVSIHRSVLLSVCLDVLLAGCQAGRWCCYGLRQSQTDTHTLPGSFSQPTKFTSEKEPVPHNITRMNYSCLVSVGRLSAFMCYCGKLDLWEEIKFNGILHKHGQSITVAFGWTADRQVQMDILQYSTYLTKMTQASLSC